ncbi:sugar-binding transcriptional regulator [Anoxybacillus rupiensis]|uniref:Sugar-binding transcriptional regulator n=1 Tax=Anoxybacteroides rupiense TaxID=311460 RepID=A0ABT5W6Q3_9BACL|nr:MULTISPECIES: sugar-binding transcriptional regulator [Anoxybacillus]MBS2770390.1 sugar-binding transcriptional regulator [Anoxybacillus rupiensis]MDE8564897.1 sugar-binding transcriptional regulator [Anoxybacillus rupiensis]QHC03358.1 sugar-binding transcriptional regulator [Anoxybacillus sp. PDR2]
MLEWEERRQLVKVATLYYMEGWTQEQIAKKIGVSRPIISKMLQRAKEVGIVEIFIKDESAHTVELEQKLEKHYGLKDAVVVPTVGLTPDMVKRAVARAGAYYLSKNLKSVKRLGISWGTTLAELVKEFPYIRKEELKIIPLEGGMGRKFVEIHANQLAHELAKKMSCTCLYLYAPAIVETEELRERLLSMPDIESVLEEGRNIDVAIIGIGNPHKSSTLRKLGYLEDDDLHYLRKLGVVGDIGFRFFDESGNVIINSFTNKVIGVSLSELKKVNRVIAVVEGIHKLESIKGALNGGFINVLIIDEQTAAAIVENW